MSKEPREATYRLTIAMATLDALGRRLYSNSAAVLAELIANAWDADATQVTIDSPHATQDKTVVIEDNGCGMSVADLNERFLLVGYSKRNREGTQTNQYARPFMGRKGIGKLSVFSIADTLTVMSRTKGGQAAGFTFNYHAVENHCRSHPTDPFYPTPLTADKLKDCPEQGTRIILSDLHKAVDGRSINPLRTRIARRFTSFNSPDESNFKVIIDGKPISHKDRKDIRNCEYIWLLGGYELPAAAMSPKTKVFHVSRDLCTLGGNHGETHSSENAQPKYLTGWLGAVSRPSQLSDNTGGETLRNIMVIARGRPIQEGILDQIAFHQLFGDYVTGQLIDDSLDDDDEDDIATSDRQRLVEHDPRVVALKETTLNVFKHVSQQWSTLRAQKSRAVFYAECPKVKTWLGSLSSHDKKVAQKLLKTVDHLYTDSNDPNSTNRLALYRGAITSFARLQAQNKLESIDPLNTDRLIPLIVEALSEYRDYEACLYGEVARNRVNAIKLLESAIENPSTHERELQLLVATNPWLLDQHWERAQFVDGVVEQTFKRRAKDMGVDLTEANIYNPKTAETTDGGKKRFDLLFMSDHSNTLIVEFKRPGLRIKWSDAAEQMRAYGEVMTKVLAGLDADKANPPARTTPYRIDERIRFAFIATEVEDRGELLDRETINGLGYMMPLNGVFYTYEEMLFTARKRYNDYLECAEPSELERVLMEIDSTIGEPSLIEEV